MSYMNVRSLIFRFLAIVCACVLPAAVSIAAVEKPAPDEGVGLQTPGDETWEYVFENRPDPFLPFIEEKVATRNIPEEEDVVLTGMQLFEPGQLKLVAILFSPNRKVAMVEDVTGKGYILSEGMLIGRYGTVSEITMDEVRITETRTVAGKEVVTPVVMRLNKDGDK
ncbi:MAG: hypothetical protein Kow0089_14360 [Desulfobulbaceae bacterium]